MGDGRDTRPPSPNPSVQTVYRTMTGVYTRSAVRDVLTAARWTTSDLTGAPGDGGRRPSGRRDRWRARRYRQDRRRGRVSVVRDRSSRFPKTAGTPPYFGGCTRVSARRATSRSRLGTAGVRPAGRSAENGVCGHSRRVRPEIGVVGAGGVGSRSGAVVTRGAVHAGEDTTFRGLERVYTAVHLRYTHRTVGFSLGDGCTCSGIGLRRVMGAAGRIQVAGRWVPGRAGGVDQKGCSRSVRSIRVAPFSTARSTAARSFIRK